MTNGIFYVTLYTGGEELRSIAEGMIFRFFRGGLYRIVSVEYNKDIQREIVYYKELNTNDILSMPKDAFLAEIDDSIYKYKFELVV